MYKLCAFAVLVLSLHIQNIYAQDRAQFSYSLLKNAVFAVANPDRSTSKVQLFLDDLEVVVLSVKVGDVLRIIKHKVIDYRRWTLVYSPEYKVSGWVESENLLPTVNIPNTIADWQENIQLYHKSFINCLNAIDGGGTGIINVIQRKKLGKQLIALDGRGGVWRCTMSSDNVIAIQPDSIAELRLSRSFFTPLQHPPQSPCFVNDQVTDNNGQQIGWLSKDICS